MGRILLLFISSLVIVSGCGPSQTARDAEATQRDAFLRKQTGDMSFLEGKWTGRMVTIGNGNGISFDEEIAALKNPAPGGTKPPPAGTKPPPPPPPPVGEQVILQILITSILTPDPTHNEVSESPTLMGVFKTTSADMNLVVFTSGLYNTRTNHLQLVSALLPGTNSVLAPTTLMLEYDGTTLKGRYVAPQRLADITLTRIQ